MAAPQERTPHERETLIFPTPEGARDFGERVAEQAGKEPIRGVRRGREITAEAVAQEFLRHGEAPGALTHPWEHTSSEHQEVQGLVDAAFAQDLNVALRQARGSVNYPRNIDLLHDVLTTELYALLQQRGMNREPLGMRMVVISFIVLAALLLIFVLLILL